jgi:hypothetical protein
MKRDYSAAQAGAILNNIPHRRCCNDCVVALHFFCVVNLVLFKARVLGLIISIGKNKVG